MMITCTTEVHVLSAAVFVGLLLWAPYTMLPYFFLNPTCISEDQIMCFIKKVCIMSLAFKAWYDVTVMICPH